MLRERQERQIELNRARHRDARIDDDGLKIDSAREIQAADARIFLPLSCAAQLRKRLAKKRRGELICRRRQPDLFGCRKRPRFAVKRRSAVLNSKSSRAISKLAGSNACNARQLKGVGGCFRAEKSRHCGVVLDRQPVNAHLSGGDETSQIETENRVLGGQVDLGRNARLIGDPDSVNGNRSQEWRVNFSELNFYFFFTHLSVQHADKSACYDLGR
jgi:hypothetical protein